MHGRKRKEVKDTLFRSINKEKEKAYAETINIIKEIQSTPQKLQSNANINGVIDGLLLKILEIKHICK